MQIIQIAVFLLIFNVSISLINATQAFPSQYDKSFDDSFITNPKDTLDLYNMTPTDISQGNDFLTAVGNFIAGSFLFFGIIATSVTGISFNISNMLGGSPEAVSIATTISFVIYIIYAIAIIQFITNRSFKGMD